MNWIALGLGVAAMALGAWTIFDSVRGPPQAPSPQEIAEPIDKCDYEIPPMECEKPIVLPPLGPEIGASRNEVWETRDGTIVQINAPMRGDLTGITMPEPIEIDGYVGSTIFEFLFWRVDGVNIRGEPSLDLVKRRADVKPHFDFDEDGYAQ